MKGESIVKPQNLINGLELALLIAVIVAVVIAFWSSVHIPVLLATVSWNG
jgi:capsular polysaccharide biosynthesis protein